MRIRFFMAQTGEAMGDAMLAMRKLVEFFCRRQRAKRLITSRRLKSLRTRLQLWRIRPMPVHIGRDDLAGVSGEWSD